jgi:gamma-glutamyltranspeptidase/glutathione hydrolase
MRQAARRVFLALALTLAGSAAFAQTPAPMPMGASVPATGRHGMVVSEQRLASEAGLAVLREGGNAVDAAVAVAYALAVTDPCCGNLGGGGFMTARLADGRAFFLDFRERAPLKATRDMYLDASGAVRPDASRRGWLAVAVPGTVAGLEYARAAWGKMSRARRIGPAIKLAEAGFALGPGDIALLAPFTKDFAADPASAAIFLKDGQPYRADDRLVQTQLGASLRLIARDGPDGFYRGSIAQAIVAASAAHGGILSLDDFAAYRAVERKPLACDYRGYRLVAAPPPSSGGVTLCEILNILEPFPLRTLGFHSAEAVHDMVEAMRQAFADRNNLLGDPDFVAMPLERLLSRAHADALRKRILADRATPSSDIALPQPEGVHTTHLSVVDYEGNAVALTYTINAFFGAKVIAPGTGFFLNDEMDDFSAKPGAPNLFGLVQGEADAITPGKRPLSSMAPTIVTKDGRLFMVTGSPGGSRIITITLETLSNVIDYGMTLQAAVDAPRFHHQWLPDRIEAEPGALSPEAAARLKAMGYAIAEPGRWGAAESILVDPATGMMTGANDSRRPAGAALGY